MKKIITAAALAIATLGMSATILAESPQMDELPPDEIYPQPYPETTDHRTIMLEVEKMPSVLLSGSLFEQPIMPTLDALESGQPTTLGEMRITSSAGMCQVSMMTSNNFMLMDQSNGSGIGAVLAQYMLEYQSPNMPMIFESNSQGPMLMDCSSPTSGMMALVPAGYDHTAPAGIYSDIVNVLVEVAM